VVFGLFARQNFVDEAAARWLFDTFAWSLGNLDAAVFYWETRLIVPSNEQFPGRESSVEGMARLIFEHVQGYAGMRHWPLRLQEHTLCSLEPPARVEIRGALRGSGGIAGPQADASSSLPVLYDAALVGNPEGLIASYAHTLAHYLARSASEPPPGGAACWPQATEVVAIFMGFGLMFANSAFNVPVRSCGTCAGTPVERRSYLTQYESAYALAIFCVLKEVPNRAVLPHLKKPLRPFFRKCRREVSREGPALRRLLAISAASQSGISEAVALPP